MPLVDGTPPPSTRTASRRQRATPLNVASTMWWVLRPPRQRDVQRDAGGGRERLPEVLGQLGVERRVAEREHLAERHLVDHEGPARQVEGHLDQRLVERSRPLAKRRTPALSPSASRERLAQRDADVLDGVVAVDLEVARRPAP